MRARSAPASSLPIAYKDMLQTKGIRTTFGSPIYADHVPVEGRVTKVLEAQRKVFVSLGCIVEEAEPDLSGADEAFHVLRAVGFVQKYAELLREHRNQIKETVIWNIEEGLKLDGPRIARRRPPIL